MIPSGHIDTIDFNQRFMRISCHSSIHQQRWQQESCEIGNSFWVVDSKAFSLSLTLFGISVWPTQPFGPRPPLGGKKIFQKEQPVMIKKPSLSIHIELYIIYPFPNNKYWRTFFHLRKVILPDFSLLGFKRKRIWIWKRKNVLGRRKKSQLIRPWSKLLF